MTDRDIQKDRLIELFQEMDRNPELTCPNIKTDESCKGCKYELSGFRFNQIARKVDYLLANGVIVPPCKVGDVVWFLVKGFDFPFEAKVNKIVIQQAGVVMSCGLKGYYSASFTINDLGKTVFLTKEEVEEKLRERNEGK